MQTPQPPKPRRRFYATLIVVALLVCIPAGFALYGLADFDLSGRVVSEPGFDHGQNHLSGTLILPEENHDGPIALIIHGDGPQDRFSDGGYLPLISALLDRGIGIYSWDKPGIGQSSGNWLDQSMDDRAAEAVAARDMIASHHPQSAGKIGLLGFSQAGWVIPKAARPGTDLAFGIIVGGAVNWQDQGAFYMRQRLLAEGVSNTEIATRIRQSHIRDKTTFALDADYASYLATTDASPPMTKARFDFVKRNIASDATDDLARMASPVLALFGADDLNVDASTDSTIYRDILSGRNTQNKVVLIDDATHGLLRSDLFNYQLASEMPASRKLIFAMMGRHAYAPGVIDQMADWITHVTTGH